MDESLSSAKSGEPTLSLNGAFLHSRYDPAEEARRYVSSLPLTGARVALCLEPGLGYLCRELKARRPDLTVLALHCSAYYADGEPLKADRGGADGIWTPASHVSLEDFLSERIEDAEAAGVKLVDWKPSLNAYGEAAAELASRAADFIRRAAAGARTSAYFGRRWVRNAAAFASRAEAVLRVEPGDAAVVVAASGPSLESALDAVREARRKNAVFVVSVSSAEKALRASGIRADLTVATDGGTWAAFHLQDAARSRMSAAVALTAALPSALYGAPLLPIADGSRWQRVLCAAGGVDAVALPQRGTVAATALDAALGMSTGTVYLAGFDFGVRDGRTHARPNALDRFWEDGATRLRPAHGAAYGRFLDAKNGEALAVYGRWMAERHGARTRLVSLHGKDTARALERLSPARLPLLSPIRLPSGGENERAARAAAALPLAIARERPLFAAAECRRGTLLRGGRTLLGELAELLAPAEYAQLLGMDRSNALSLDSIDELAEKTSSVLREIVSRSAADEWTTAFRT